MKRTTALAALLPLTICWAQAASAAAQAQPPAPITAPVAQPQTQDQSSLVAGTITPQVFTLPQQRYTLPPRDYLNSEQNSLRIIDPTPPRTTRDRGLNFGPIIIRRDPNPEPGCRVGIRGARLQLRCVR